MPGFTQVFGGTVIYPAQVSYRAVSLTADTELTWPTELATGTNVVAEIMDVTATVGPHALIMPPADQVSVGQTSLIFNVGSNSFTVKDNDENVITTIAAGLAYQIYLRDNSTTAGLWRAVQYGAGVSEATAGPLAGYGIVALNDTLNQSTPVVSLVADFTIQAPNRASALVWEGGAGTLTLDSASTLGDNFFLSIRNSGTGGISLETSVGGQTIDGDSSKFFNPGDSAIVLCDGSNFFTIGFGQAPEFLFDYVSIDLTAETSPFTLMGANLNRIAYRFSGTITGDFEIIVPNTVQQYWPANDTDLASDPYIITLKTAAGTGVSLTRGARAIVYCDGTNVVDADTSTISLPITIAQGGTGATTASGARVSLGGTATGIAVFTAASAAAGRSALSAAASGANSDITSLSGLTTPLSVAQGGTGVTTSTGTGATVRAVSPTLTTPNLGTPSAATLTNATGLPLTTGVTGTLPVANGGTGAATLTSKNLLVGNGTGAVQFIAPGSPGDILVSDGTDWAASRLLGSGPDIIIQLQRSATTGGSTIAAGGGFQTRELNTVVRDLNGVASLSSNQITLPAGTWSFTASVSYGVAGGTISAVKTRIYNATDASVTGIGENVRPMDTGTAVSTVYAVETIASSKAFEVQCAYQSTGGGILNEGFAPGFSGGVEVYLTVTITKIAA